ncbi:hypothetical protein FF011L_38770 [Roseimaritima multifibrata]|uniref:Uncharacterized protein n=1 Tax=Roseimaritima multifibrata TaxID=1930274 RepID=A0A517MJN4_9BACT|nr:hypothetical protein FF011L_38770 [Roseimaritima multifibrata]
MRVGPCCVLLVLAEFPSVIVAFVLVSNQFGNTDMFGLPLLGLSGWGAAMGTLHLRFRLPSAALIGMLVGLLTMDGTVVLFWVCRVSAAVA